MIFTIRGQRVIIDRDLANLHEVDVKSLNRAVKKNLERFPDFFEFQLTDEETYRQLDYLIDINRPKK